MLAMLARATSNGGAADGDVRQQTFTIEVNSIDAAHCVTMLIGYLSISKHKTMATCAISKLTLQRLPTT
jgi:hypothetical protein